eukprot:9444664-Pyramimonas_sp.AAC.2
MPDHPVFSGSARTCICLESRNGCAFHAGFIRIRGPLRNNRSGPATHPTKPWVSLEIFSRSTSSSSFMFLVWMRSTSRRPISSGTPMSISRSKRPKRRSAASIEFGRLVAPITMTCDRDFMPSISVSSCDTMRRSTSPCASPDRRPPPSNVYTVKAHRSNVWEAPRGRVLPTCGCSWRRRLGREDHVTSDVTD